MRLKVYPLTSDRWKDFEDLFGARGACGGCWCMFWKLTRARFQKEKGEANKRAMEKRVRSGEMPGFLAYRDGEAVGWCAVEPRGNYPRLARSRVLAPVDEARVWSVPCFFVKKERRRRGISAQMLKAVADALRSDGVTLLEGYPVEPRSPMPDPFVYTGLASAFRRAGFREVARRSPTRPIMRRRLRPTGHAP